MTVNPKFIALIPAAGSSSRMGGGNSKLLCEVAGQTVIERTLTTILSCARIERVVVLCREQERAVFAEILTTFTKKFNKASELVLGGASRRESVWNGLRYIESEIGVSSSTYVVVHDAARCFLSTALLERSLTRGLEKGAVSVALPIVDSIKRVDMHGQIEASLNRDTIWAVQTPQVFRFDLLWQAHTQALQRQDSVEATDDAALVEKLHPVYVVEGERLNFKVTTIEDLEFPKLLKLPS